MGDELARAKAEAYLEGYRQCLEDVEHEGVDAARRVAESETLLEDLTAAYVLGAFLEAVKKG